MTNTGRLVLKKVSFCIGDILVPVSKKIGTPAPWVGWILVFLCLGLFRMAKRPESLSLIGEIATICALVGICLAMGLLACKGQPVRLGRSLWSFFLGFVLLQVLLTLIYQSPLSGVRFVAQLIFLGLALFVFMSVDLNEKAELRLGSFRGFLSWGLLTFSLVGVLFEQYHGYRVFNPNSAGIMAYVGTALALIKHNGVKNWVSFLAVILGASILYTAEARASLLAFAIMLCAIFSWRYITAGRFPFWAVFSGTLALTPIFYGVLSLDPSAGLGARLDSVSRQVFNRSLFTGRGEYWNKAAEIYADAPIAGWGPGAPIAEVGASSTHNSYIQVALQSGFVGLLLFLLILGAVWHGLWNGRNQARSAPVGGFFLGAMALGTFEVLLIDNIYPFSLLLWSILGLGLSGAERRICLSSPRWNGRE